MNATDDGALAFEQLTYLFAARAASDKGVPAVCTLAARWFAALHFDLFPTIESTSEDAFDLFWGQFSKNADAELTYEVVDCTLQRYAEFTVRSY